MASSAWWAMTGITDYGAGLPVITNLKKSDSIKARKRGEQEQRVRVLQLISSGGFYGAENMLLNLAASQKRMGLCEPRLLLFYNVNQPNEELYRRAMSLGLDVRMLRCEGRADLRAIKEIREYIRTEKIDLIHTHGYKADLYGYLAARTESKPIVATCHNWVGGP